MRPKLETFWSSRYLVLGREQAAGRGALQPTGRRRPANPAPVPACGPPSSAIPRYGRKKTHFRPCLIKKRGYSGVDQLLTGDMKNVRWPSASAR
jgi:hypothetical protein